MDNIFVLQLFGLFLLMLSFLCSVFLFFYNRLVRREEEVKESWSQISLLYKKEVDLIPPLLRVLNGYTRREQEAIASILSARTRAQVLLAEINGMYSSAKKVRHAQETEGMIRQGLHKMDLLKKDYPLLTQDHYYLSIENELRKFQRSMSEARRNYNRVAAQYNDGLKLFPLNMMSSLFHFEHKAYFTETN